MWYNIISYNHSAVHGIPNPVHLVTGSLYFPHPPSPLVSTAALSASEHLSFLDSTREILFHSWEWIGWYSETRRFYINFQILKMERSANTGPELSNGHPLPVSCSHHPLLFQVHFLFCRHSGLSPTLLFFSLVHIWARDTPSPAP